MEKETGKCDGKEVDPCQRESESSKGLNVVKGTPAGILRVDLGKLRRMSMDLKFLGQIEPASPQPSVDRLSVTFADESLKTDNVSPKMDKVHFPPTTAEENHEEEEEEYSNSVTAIMQRRASIRRSKKRTGRRGSSPFSPDILPETENGRRRSSVFTTSSGDTAISMEDSFMPSVTQEQIFENIKMHKEVLSSVKMQPWNMRKKLRLVVQAKSYIKRHEGVLQERLAHSHSTKDILARFNIYLIKKLQYWKREAANMSNWLIPWELRIKEIESHFGSVVASYFIFLRWLFWVNLVISAILIAFVAVPEMLKADVKKDPERKSILPEDKYNSTNFLTLWDFEGIFKYSPMFYGWYTNIDSNDKGYRLPLAYFFTGLVVYAYSFVATLRKMAKNSRMSKLSEKEDECIFSWKLFTGWDYMIGNAETAHNRVASIVMSFKEALLEEAEKKREAQNWRIIGSRILVNIAVLGLLALSACAVVTVVARSNEKEASSTTWRRNEITVVMSLISLFFPILFELLGFFEKYHPRKQLRLQLARIMVLNLLNLYSLIFALFGKISIMTNHLQTFKPNDTVLEATTLKPILPTSSTPNIIDLFTKNTTNSEPFTTENYFNFTNMYLAENLTSLFETENITAIYENITNFLTEYINNKLENITNTIPIIDSNENFTYENLYNITDMMPVLNITDFLNETFAFTNVGNFTENVPFTQINFTQFIEFPENVTTIDDLFPDWYDEIIEEMEMEKAKMKLQEIVSNVTNLIDNLGIQNISNLPENFKDLLASALTQRKNVSTYENKTDCSGDYKTRTRLRSLCWETMFGQELVKLTVMDLVLTVLSTLAIDFFRGIFVRYMNSCWCWDLEKRFPQYGDFKVAENILHLVYNQGMVWMGMFFSPGLVVLNLFKLYIMMYLRSWAVLTCNVPHEVIFRASRSNNFYFALLLMMLFLCVLPVGYTIVWLEPSWHCGPFSNYQRIFHVFTKTIKRALPETMHKILDYIASPGIVIPLLVLLILIIYYLISLTNALREANDDLKIQLRRERTEERKKMFQIADRRRRGGSEGSGELNAPFTKWKKLFHGLPSGKSFDETPKQESVEIVPEERNAGKGILSKFILRTLKTRKPSVSDEDGTDTEQHESLPDDPVCAKENKQKHEGKPKLESIDSIDAKHVTIKDCHSLKREDSSGSIIPVIKISKTESSECILESKTEDSETKGETKIKIDIEKDVEEGDKWKPRIKYILKKQVTEIENDESTTAARNEEMSLIKSDMPNARKVSPKLFKSSTNGTESTQTTEAGKTESSTDYKDSSFCN